MVSTVAPSIPDELLTPDEFRARFHGRIGRNAIYDALHARRIRHLRFGRRILILATEVQEWPRREAVGPS